MGFFCSGSGSVMILEEMKKCFFHVKMALKLRTVEIEKVRTVEEDRNFC